MRFDEWPEVQLGDLVTIKHGWPFKSQHFSEQLTGRPIVVAIGNFAYTGGFRFESTAVKEYRGDYPLEYELAPGETLLVMTCQTSGGEILGIPANVPDDGRVYLHNQRIGRVVNQRPDRVDSRYLYWLFASPAFNHELATTASGSKILHTSPSRIEAFRFRLPPVVEQQQIADALDRLQNKIELNRRTNRTLERIAQAIFKSWFVDFDPVLRKLKGGDIGLPPKLAALFPPAFDESQLGPIPQGWRAGNCSDSFAIAMGQSPPGDTYNEAEVGLPFYQGRRDFGERFPTRRVYCVAPSRLARRGDTLVSVRAPVGDVNIATEDCCIGRGVAAVRHTSGASLFTYEAMRALRLQFEDFEAGGTVFGSIGGKEFRNLQVVVPPAELIRAYESAMGPIRDALEVAHRGSRSLALLRNFTLPQLMAGELRPPDLHSGGADVTAVNDSADSGSRRNVLNEWVAHD